MHANEKRISERVIGAAYEVSNELGAGFLERVYENALALELAQRGIVYTQQARLQVCYRHTVVGEYVADLIVEDQLLVEIKALSQLTRQHEAQVMNYLKATGLTVGLLLNFGTGRIGIRRIVSQHDERHPI